MKCVLGLLVLLAVSALTEEGVVRRMSEDDGELTVTEQLEKVNINLRRKRDGVTINGDIAASRPRAVRSVGHQAVKLWPKSIDGNVYIPYVIADDYSSEELELIKRAITSFSSSTCIRFQPRTDETDFLFIQPLEGCYSYIGHQGYSQTVSLSRRGCIHFGTIQHELLHALGFNHEQCRSDRDEHIQVLMQNVRKGKDFNFNKVDTLNQKTPYDYDSVMHYGRLAYSKDKQNPTMVAVPNPNEEFGTAKQMSQIDIDRVNLLYCRNEPSS